MLLPSDVARLVLGYLQEEGLSATSQAFIHESPNLKEYAEHSSGDGTVPACVFSLFGKNLTTLLNEYVAVKAKESGHEVPLVMTSLWKKLDFTLSQIKSLQNSPTISANQRIRSRIGVANMARQRVLTVATAGGVVCSSVSETSSIISPAQTSHCMLSHSTPVSFSGTHTRAAAAQQLIHDGGRLLNTPRDSPVPVAVSEHRLNSGPISPARRKWDTPRKRSGLGGPSAPSRSAPAASSLAAEAEPEEAVDENFPQLVIQNACDKILGDRLLQEKLAENINKILANEPAPPTSKASVSTVEAEQSIDEILGLQGEIHMSDDAIHDILEQTESDPAFQALFDLFEYNKTKSPDGEAVDGDTSSSPDENETAGPSSAIQPLQSHDAGPTQGDVSVSDIQPAALKIRAAPERRTRRSTVSTVVKKTILDSSGRASRIENSSARLLVTHGGPQGATPAALNSRRKEKPNLLIESEGVTQMDIGEPLHTPPPPPLDSLVSQEHTSICTPSCPGESVPVPSANDPTTFTEASNVNKTPNEPPSTIAASPIIDHPDVFSSVAVCTPCLSGSATDENTLTVSSVPATADTVTATSPSSAPTPAPGSSTSATPFSPASSCAPVAATPTPSATHPSTLSKATDSNNMVSLKIIVSDSQDEDSSSDAALNRAISSISGDKIPTIYLTSPAKSPECPATPKANFDEAAQAVSGLQSSEACGTPIGCKASAVNTAQFIGTPQNQQRYIFQLPVDATSPGLQGSAASFYLVTPTTEVPPRQVLLPAGVPQGTPLPVNQHGGATPTYPQSFSTGSAFILPSPMKPVVLPVSVLGQNAVGTRVQMMSNQLVDTANSAPVQQKETSPTTVATKPASGTGKRVPAVVQGENPCQQDAAKGSSHKRILCFDSSSPEVQPQSDKTTETTSLAASKSSASQSDQQSEKDRRIKPNILGGNKPKRRIAPVRCAAAPRAEASSLKESVPLQMQQKDSVKKTARKQVYSIHKKPEHVNRVSKPEAEKQSEPEEASTPDRCNDVIEAKDARCSGSNESTLKPGSGKDREESSRKEAADKAPVRSREGRTEKRTPSQEVPNVLSNKENEMKGSVPEQQQQSTPSSSASRDFSPPAVTQPSHYTQASTPKTPSKASSLAKQAIEMLQGLGSPSTPVKKPGAGSPELSLPGTGRTPETPADCPRTPSQHRKGKDGEGTPRHLITPNASDVPTCSPASEAGSENSINMAAHTLMILSRAAIARTGTPLKDSMRQEGAGEMSPTSSKNSKNKKRKHTSLVDSPPAKREAKRSPSRRKDQERKKLIDCFPHDLDVDKFLSSLHYDE
uniref:Nuclear protein, ataxia-telangiectasia locus n=1 Tax=Iconisemion striatum TaxID=60296 RepID=A0A1A7XYH1_9TELE